MKKKYFILASVVVVVIAAAVVASFWGRKNTHGNVIPKDASALALLDLKKLVTEADLNAEEQQKFVNRLLHLDVDVREIGLDLTQPLYGFATREGNLGAVAAVSDQDNLETLCTRLHEKGVVSQIEQQRGYAWVTVAHQWLLCFDNSKALMMGPAVGSAQDQLRSQMVELMEQERDDSGLLLPAFTKLTEKEEPLTLITDAQLIPADVRKQLCELLKVEQLNDVQLLLGIDAEANRVEIDADIITQNLEVQAQLQLLNGLLRPIEGSLIERLQSNALLCVMCNVEGATLLEQLRKNPKIRTGLLGLNMMVDADQMLKAIDGDVSFEVTDLAFLLGLSSSPSLRMLAKVKDMDFLQQKDYWLKSAASQSAYTLTADGEDFCLKAKGFTTWFGAEDNILYAASSQALSTAERVEQVNSFLQDQRSQLRDSRFFLTIDMQPLAAMGRLFGQDNVLGLTRLFERVNIEMKEPGCFDLLLVAPEGKNLAKSLLLKY